MPSNDESARENVRTESDSLGNIEVPAEALYGAQTQRAKENFPISGLRFPGRFLRALALVKRACAEANCDLGLLAEEKKEAIAEATERMAATGENDVLADHFPLDIFQTGSGTSTNMNANEVLANLASEIMGAERGSKAVHPNDDVNMSQSSNDVIPTTLHVAAQTAISEELLPALRRLEDTFSKKADAFDDVLKSGRTHLMDATPVRLGQELGGYAMQVRRGRERVARAAEELGEVALGGTATGTGLNRPTDFPGIALTYLSDLTGSTFREAENHFEAQSDKAAVVSTSGALNALATSLLKIANDLRLLSSGPTSGIGEIRLPVIQPGSSIMPGKVNPVQSEAMMMACTRVMGHHTTISASNTHGNFELNVMMPVMAHALLESIEILAGACEAFREKCARGIEADRARCRELLELNPSIATALNTAIGYDKASEVAKKAAAERKPVRQVVREMDLLSDEELETLLDVRAMTEPGVPGE